MPSRRRNFRLPGSGALPETSTPGPQPLGAVFSPVGNLLDFHADYDIRRGDLHDVDESSKINAFESGSPDSSGSTR